MAITLEEGATRTLDAIVLPKDAVNTEVVWTSSNPNVATVTDGVVTAVAVGTATITAKVADTDLEAYCPVSVTEKTKENFTGITFENATFTYDGTEKVIEISGKLPEGANVVYNGNKGVNVGGYAATATITKEGYNTLTLNATLTIEKKEVEVVSIDLDASTAVLNGVLDADAADVELDFDKINKSYEFGDTKVTAIVTNLVLKGAKAGNYAVITDEVQVDCGAPQTADIDTGDVSATAEIYDDTVKIVITDTSALTDDTAVFDTTTENVSAVAIPASNIKDLANNNKSLQYKVKDETGKAAVVTLNKDALETISTGIVSGDITIRVSNPDDTELTSQQKDKKDGVATKQPTVYKLTVEGGNGTSFGGENVTVTLYYNQTVSGTVIVKFIATDGTETQITNAVYDSVNKTVTFTVPHFSEYLVYTEPASSGSSGGGGGGGSVSTSVKVNVNGGTAVNVRVGQTIGTVTAPTKEGYVFTGWYKNADCTEMYADTDKITRTSELYAGWKIDPARQITLTIGDKNAVKFGEDVVNDVAPIIRNDRTMLPIRFIAEALGAQVDWDGETRAVTITSEDITIKIAIGESFAIVNDQIVELDSPAFIESDRTFLPLRFVSENLGAQVDWIEETRQVVITK